MSNKLKELESKLESIKNAIKEEKKRIDARSDQFLKLGYDDDFDDACEKFGKH